MEEIYQKVNEDIKLAIKDKYSKRLITLRAIKTDLENFKHEKKGNDVITNEVATRIMQKMVKKRTDSAQIYRDNKRSDLEAIEMAEIFIINEYIPTLMSETDIRKKLLQMIGKTGTTSISQIGTFLKTVMPEFEGKTDRQVVSKMARGLVEAYERQTNNK